MEKSQCEYSYFQGIRPQQIDPETQELYPWWVPSPDGQIQFDPDKFQPSYPYEPPGRVLRLPSNPQQVFESPFDLDNLRFIDPADVEKAYDQLVEGAKENPDKLLTVLIGTGGTIAMLEETGILKPKLDVKKIIGEAGNKSESFVTADISLPKLIDSSQMEIDYAADVAIATSWLFRKLVEEHEDLASQFAGYIVCHGTDTAVQSQTYLSFMLGPNCPFNVFYVVAQKTTQVICNDVGANVGLAFDACLKFKSTTYPLGIHGICAGGISGGVFNGPTSLKISDQDILLLQDYNAGGPLLDASKVTMPENLRFYDQKKEYESTNRNMSGWLPLVLRGENVAKEIKPRMGDSAEDYEETVRRTSAKFIIIETFGSFTVNRKIVDAVVKAARETGKLVFATNPFPQGSTDHSYADARNLVDQGIIPLRMLTHAAFAKLLWADHVFGNDRAKIIKFMTENNFCNEQLYVDYIPALRTHDEFIDKLKTPLAREFVTRMSLQTSHLQESLESMEYPGIPEEDRPRMMRDKERFYAMNDPDIRRLIESTRSSLFTLIISVLQPYIISYAQSKEFSESEIKILQRAVENDVHLILNLDGISTILERSNLKEDLTGQKIQGIGIGYIGSIIMTVLEKVLPRLGQRLPEEIEDFAAILGPFNDQITELGLNFFNHMIQQTALRDKMLAVEMPRFGMPKVLPTHGESQN